jgi:hypothetical protein
MVSNIQTYSRGARKKLILTLVKTSRNKKSNKSCRLAGGGNRPKDRKEVTQRLKPLHVFLVG